ncbi:MAG: TetR/AcrR family transcriptional regulator [Nitrospirota bacterium]
MITAKKPRRERAAMRREEILSVGLRLFSERGYHATSIRTIARTAGITEGLIYHYFDSKEDLLMTIVERSNIKNNIETLEIPDNLPIHEALRLIGYSFFERLSRSKEVFRLMIGESYLFEKEGKLFFPKMIYENGMKGMGKFLKKRMDAGELKRRDPVLAARQFMGSLVSFFIFQEILSGKRVVNVEPGKFLNLSIKIFLEGMSKA